MFSQLNCPPRLYPCLRFAVYLAIPSARLGAEQIASPFVRIFHSLLQAGLTRRTNQAIALRTRGLKALGSPIRIALVRSKGEGAFCSAELLPKTKAAHCARRCLFQQPPVSLLAAGIDHRNHRGQLQIDQEVDTAIDLVAQRSLLGRNNLLKLGDISHT